MRAIGGRRSPPDNDLLETSIRETKEECGISLQPSELHTQLTPLTVHQGALAKTVLVAPFVFHLKEKPPIVLSSLEISDYAWVKRSFLCDIRNHHKGFIIPKYPNIAMPYVNIEGLGKLWGFTYRVTMSYLGVREI